ncbi:MAG: hypothetical protein GY789_12755 [Hyphomicrobiales bacterium]|nr:hypothetical protein [Hyphomicrobiales bacterium]
MNREKFAYLSLIGLGLLLGFLIVFPNILSFLVHAALQGKSCSDYDGACGALAAVIGAIVKPIGIVVISAFLVWVFQRRLHMLDISGGWTVVGAFWLIGSLPYLVAARNFWGANFAMGLLYVQLPFLLAYFVVFLAFLWFVKYAPSDAPDQRQQKAWLAVLATSGYILLISAQTIVAGLGLIPYVGTMVNVKLQIVFGQIAYFARLGLPQPLVLGLGFIVFSGTLAYIIYCQNNVRIAPAPARSADNRPTSKISRQEFRHAQDDLAVESHEVVQV